MNPTPDSPLLNRIRSNWWELDTISRCAILLEIWLVLVLLIVALGVQGCAAREPEPYDESAYKKSLIEALWERQEKEK